jgi:hemerythrin-like domain-containing protein
MTYGELLDNEPQLIARFIDHQLALMSLDLKSARRHFDAFAAEQRRHIRIEEELILPVFAQRAGIIEGGTPDLFLAEHRKIEQSLNDIDARLKKLPPEPRAALDLIDFEWLFKQLIDHHDTRERNVLYPTLHRITTPQERDELRRAIDSKPSLLDSCRDRQSFRSYLSVLSFQSVSNLFRRLKRGCALI